MSGRGASYWSFWVGRLSDRELLVVLADVLAELKTRNLETQQAGSVRFAELLASCLDLVSVAADHFTRRAPPPRP